MPTASVVDQVDQRRPSIATFASAQARMMTAGSIVGVLQSAYTPMSATRGGDIVAVGVAGVLTSLGGGDDIVDMGGVVAPVDAGPLVVVAALIDDDGRGVRTADPRVGAAELQAAATATTASTTATARSCNTATSSSSTGHYR